MKSPETNLNPTPEQQTALLEKINQALAELGSGAKWKRAPEFLAEYEPLRGKKIIMVDDLKKLLEHFVPLFMVATDGNAGFVEHLNQTIDELVDQIIHINPDIVLLDFNLANNVLGSEIAEKLTTHSFSGISVGFSSDTKTAEKFIAAGAIGAVDKDAGDPEKSVVELAKLIANK